MIEKNMFWFSRRVPFILVRF